jgi:hypothetical protein
MVTLSFAAFFEDEQPLSMQQLTAAHRQTAISFHRLCFFIAAPPTLAETDMTESKMFQLKYGRMMRMRQHKASHIFA